MNRKLFFFMLIGGFILPTALFADTLYVKVRDSKLRKAPRILSSSVATLRFGDELEMIEELEGWASAKTRSGRQGYVSLSAVTENKSGLEANLSSGGKASGGSSDDTTLAGRGVRPEEIEREFLRSNPAANIAAVNRMERMYKVDDSSLLAFMRSGKLEIQE